MGYDYGNPFNRYSGGRSYERCIKCGSPHNIMFYRGNDVCTSCVKQFEMQQEKQLQNYNIPIPEIKKEEKQTINKKLLLL
jgi:ribosomal protein S14